MSTPTRAILWDMDGTLIDSEPAHEAAFDSALRETGLTVPESLHADLLGASGDTVFAALQEATGTPLSLADWTRLKHRHFEHHARAITRLPAAALAERLAARGVPMALVSNSTAEEVAFCLRTTGLDTLLTTVVTRADVAQGKPAPEGYLLAARRLGVAPQQCLVVEDSPTGAAAGCAAGMQVIYHPQFPDPSPPPGARYVAPDQPPVPLIETFLTQKDLL
ncbi:haloacid dehalogenase superfamily, subfamily IA, variant 3 with third motif protein having DD or ED (plasmid) [Marinovum algicola DG 898]|nr:haloacid dehalogenase superfamily, subfamily IA, variant 3 with third motif protein having DD or ED [Marinovum algicola DG 898]